MEEEIKNTEATNSSPNEETVEESVETTEEVKEEAPPKKRSKSVGRKSTKKKMSLSKQILI